MSSKNFGGGARTCRLRHDRRYDILSKVTNWSGRTTGITTYAVFPNVRHLTGCPGNRTLSPRDELEGTPNASPAHTSGPFCQNQLPEALGSFRQNAVLRFRHHGFSVRLLSRGGSVAARRIPADCRSKLSVSNPSHSQTGKRSAEIRRRGTPHPLADLTVAPVPPAGGNCRSITRTGAPFGAPLRRFSLVPGTAF